MNLPSRSTATVERPDGRHRSEIRLQGAWLALARIAWVVIAGFSIGLFVAALTSFFAYLHNLNMASPHGPQLAPSDVRELQGLGLSLDFYAWLNISVNVLILLVYSLVGVVLFWRKSDDRMALLASLTLVLFPIGLNSQIAGTLPPEWTAPTACVEFFGYACVSLFIYLFPSGRFVPRWTRWLMVGLGANWASSAFFPHSSYSNSWISTVLFFVLIASPIILQIYRYRRVSTPVQRQQIKWVVFGITVAFGSLLIGAVLLYGVLPQFFPMSPLTYTIGFMPVELSLLLFPLSIGFAILRYRLWDIDSIINRTLVYGLLSGILGVIYAGLIIGFESLAGAITGQTLQQPVVLVISTLAIATLFQPLRTRIQQIIDRRFYRRKYDAARTLEAFSAMLRNEVDLATLSEHLLTVVEETMQPTHVSLWLRPAHPREKAEHLPVVGREQSINQLDG
jgi:hypothetical protein